MSSFSRRHFLSLCAASSMMPALSWANARPELLIYCGITMVRPISEIAALFEQQHQVKVTISQGGSEDLYRSLKASRKGDLYLPGEPSYRERYLNEGLMEGVQTIGYNQAALFVRKGNPKKVTADPHQLLRSDLVTVLCTAEQGSIGLETQKILSQLGIYEKALAQASELLPDSRMLNQAMKQGTADITINWRATAFFPDNQPHIDAIGLPKQIAKPQALLLNKLSFSNHPQLTKAFIELAASSQGQAIMRKHGFLDNSVPLD